jgi:hypothetical protein
MTELDQQKAGLQDDHDPGDPGQKQNDKPKGDFKPPKQPAGPHNRDKESADNPPDSDVTGGVGSQGGM